MKGLVRESLIAFAVHGREEHELSAPLIKRVWRSSWQWGSGSRGRGHIYIRYLQWFRPKAQITAAQSGIVSRKGSELPAIFLLGRNCARRPVQKRRQSSGDKAKERTA